jgi:ATP synthase F1 complex assembly factor 2
MVHVNNLITHTGFVVELDKRKLKSPDGNIVTIPKQHPSLALLVAGEWESQDKLLKSTSLPVVSVDYYDKLKYP